MPRHRGIPEFFAGARQRRSESTAAAGIGIRRGRHIALLSHGRIEGRVRRIGGRMDTGRRTGVFKNVGADGRVLQTRRRRSRETMNSMRSIVVDKIASVTQACGLSHELRIAPEIPCAEGLVLVVEILTNKANYNTLELTSGRMAKVVRGDVVVGALGHRKALFGYSGHIPTSLAPGDIVQMLNIGGVLGICDSATPDKGKPFDCKVLGTVLTFPFLGERIGVPARVGYKRVDPEARLEAQGVPVVALA